MEELIATLVRQAFASQNERIEELKKELDSVKKESQAQKDKIKDLEELNTLMDKAITECKDLLKTYVDKDDENNLMEEYKFGEQQRN